MARVREQGAVFALGAAGYAALELMWRQYTHWSMALAGGACLVILYNFYARCERLAVGLKCLLGSGVITGVELLAGLLVNCWQKWNIWDYTCFPLNFMGQICPLYSALWGLLCLPLCPLCRVLRRKLHSSPARMDRREKEVYNRE